MKKEAVVLIIVFLVGTLFYACKPEPQLPVAGFGSGDNSPGEPQVGDTIWFKNYSTNATHYLWNFGDGTTSTSAAQSITHIYSITGLNKTSLTAYSQNGNSNQFSEGCVYNPSSGNACFWFSTTAIYGRTVVAIGTSSDTVKYTTGLPSACGQSGCANFQLPPGIYNYSAAELPPGTHTWSGSITIAKHGCIKQQLL